MDQPKCKASWPFWVLGVLLMLGAFGVAGAVLVPAVMRLGEDLIRVKVPGETVLNLKETGTYTIFQEVRGRANALDEDSPDVLCTLIRQSDGIEVELREPGASQNFTFNNQSGVSVLEFTIDQGGAYTLVTESDESTMLVVVHDFIGRLMRLVSKVWLVGIPGLLALVMFILAIVRTARNRRIRRTPVATIVP